MVERAAMSKAGGKKKQDAPVVVHHRERRTTVKGNQAPSERGNSLTPPKRKNTVRDSLNADEAMASNEVE